MDGEHSTAREWLETAAKGIRFRPDRLAVEAELREHLEDKTADMARIFHIEGEEAEKEALKRMGDPEEIGKKLAQIHKPWLGYLWTASKWLVVIAFIVALPLLLVKATEWPWISSEWRTNSRTAQEMEYWVTGGSQPHHDAVPHMSSEAFFHPDESLWVGSHRLEMKRAGLWSSGEYQELYCELKTTSLPWQIVDSNSVQFIRAADSMENTYQCIAGYRTREPGETRRVGLFSWNDRPLGRDFLLYMTDVPTGAEWIRLEYDRAGIRWSMTVSLKESEVGG